MVQHNLQLEKKPGCSENHTKREILIVFMGSRLMCIYVATNSTQDESCLAVHLNGFFKKFISTSIVVAWLLHNVTNMSAITCVDATMFPWKELFWSCSICTAKKCLKAGRIWRDVEHSEVLVLLGETSEEIWVMTCTNVFRHLLIYLLTKLVERSLECS